MELKTPLYRMQSTPIDTSHTFTYGENFGLDGCLEAEIKYSSGCGIESEHCFLYQDGDKTELVTQSEWDSRVKLAEENGETYEPKDVIVMNDVPSTLIRDAVFRFAALQTIINF